MFNCVYLPLGKIAKGFSRYLRLSLRQSVRFATLLVRTITRQGYELETPYLNIMCIVGPSRTLLKMSLIDLDFQCHFEILLMDFHKMELVRTITGQEVEVETALLHRMCILIPSRTLLKRGQLTLSFKLIFAKSLHCHISGAD